VNKDYRDEDCIGIIGGQEYRDKPYQEYTNKIKEDYKCICRNVTIKHIRTEHILMK